MDYKKELIELLDSISNERIIKYIYLVVKEYVENRGC